MKKIVLTLFLFSFLSSDIPKLNEPKIFEEYEIPNKSKNDLSQKYDILSLKQVLKSAFKENQDTIFYQKKISYLLNEIKKDKYNFDIYLSAYARTGRVTSTKYANSAYTEEGVRLNFNKLLYDGDYFLIQKYDILNKRLALINELNAKKRLRTLIVTNYINLYFDQESLKVLKIQLQNLKKIFEKIKKLYKQQKISQLAFIKAKTDLLNLQDLYATKLKSYIHNDFVLREILNSHSKKPFLLQPFNIELKIDKFPLLQTKVIKNNSDILKERNNLKLKELDYISTKRKFHPTITFNSFVGYSFTKNKEFDISKQGSGTNWEIALNLKQPIYNRGDIQLKTQKAKYDLLLQKEKLKSIQKTALINLENLYRTIQFLNIKIDILKQKTDLLKITLNLYTKRFLAGVISYDVYANALNKYIKSLETLQNLKRKVSINKLLLSEMLK